MTTARRLLVGAVALVCLAAPPLAGATAEEDLAARYAPVVRLVEQAQQCGYGESYEPIDVDLLFDEPTVALRGPWNRIDLVKIGPAAEDLVGLFEYHLDFPGNPLEPGCSYERWARRLAEGSEPTVYAHVATEDARPGKVALQYWFFYAFNDFNNTHEGDWEMIQLVFDASDAEEALGQTPADIGYSSHEGAERSEWDDEKLELVDRTHPVVYPGAGSHANKYTEALYLGSSAEAGVGCDDTRGPHREIRPTVTTIPSDPEAAQAAFPWIEFEGRWGELQPAFFNGPTGPNLKTQWTRPVTWSEGWRDVSYAVPTGGLLGTGATDLFCSGVERGSRALILLLRSPALVAVAVGLLAALVAFVVIRATWTPSTPLRLARRRSWGQILSASARMYARRPRVFLEIGLLLLPILLVSTLLQWIALEGLGLVGIVNTGESAAGSAILAFAIGSALALLGLAGVQAAIARALVAIDEGHSLTALEAYRMVSRNLRPLLATVVLFVLAWVVLTTIPFLIPIAVILAVRWSLAAPIVELERTGGAAALRRSHSLVHGRWLRTGSLVGLSAAVALISGPLIGALLIFAVNLPLATINIVAGLVYVIALPFVGLVTAYAYFDARARQTLQQEQPAELPAEFAL